MHWLSSFFSDLTALIAEIQDKNQSRADDDQRYAGQSRVPVAVTRPDYDSPDPGGKGVARIIGNLDTGGSEHLAAPRIDHDGRLERTSRPEKRRRAQHRQDDRQPRDTGEKEDQQENDDGTRLHDSGYEARF